jgi:hypothetical protein
MLGGGAKSMRFVALVAVAVAAGSPVESMAATLSKASGLMTSGVRAYIKETQNGRSERQAHALIDASLTNSPHERALEDVEDKAMQMAKQMLANLERLAKAAKKIEETVKAEASKVEETRDRDSKNHQESSGILSGKSERLEHEIEGLRETNHDLEDEKRSLIDSVQQMLHGSKKEELKECHGKVDETLKSLKEAKEHSEQVEKQLRDDNDALTAALQKCHEEKTAATANAALSVQPSAVLSEVECKDKLRTLELKQADDEDKRQRVEKTVTMMMRTNEQLKEQIAKKGAAPASSSPAPQKPRMDIGHMAETTKMDMYISQSEGELAAISEFNPKVAQTAKVSASAANAPATEAPAKEAPAKEKPAVPAPKHAEVAASHLKLSAKAQKEAQHAIKGEGVIGRYLRGETQKQSDDADVAAVHNTTASLDAALQQLQVAESTDVKAQPSAPEKDDDGDDLARRLLLQAEHNLKLAA